MKSDVLDALSGRFPRRIPSKETLNHPGIINQTCGFDVFEDTPRAFDQTWRKLGIDIHVAPPAGNAPRPKVPGGTWQENGRTYSDYGVFPTAMETESETAAELDEDELFAHDPSSQGHDPAERSARLRAANAAFRQRYGELAVHYDLYYTTLFMWPVVTFGWEKFMLAAATDPERFDRCFWQPWAELSRREFAARATLDEEVIFCHDDLAMTAGPVFAPDFYERYIFSRYEWILEPAVRAGKKIVFVSDGNIDLFLERLLKFPFAGLMFENPATPFARVLETWGQAGRGFIGGISTALLTNGTPEAVRAHTREVMEAGRRYPGFVVSSCGGLPGNIPLANLKAYFETRAELGCTEN